MKLRPAFVSNSSSCSFIINLNNVREKIKDISIESFKKNLQKLVDVYNQVHKKEVKLEDILTIGILSKKDAKSFIDHYVQSHSYNIKEQAKERMRLTQSQLVKPGSIIIDSVSDNSIPFILMEWFEFVYKAQHYHWG